MEFSTAIVPKGGVADFENRVATLVAGLVGEGHKAVVVTIATSFNMCCLRHNPTVGFFRRPQVPTAQKNPSGGAIFGRSVAHVVREFADSHPGSRIHVSVITCEPSEIFTEGFPGDTGMDTRAGGCMLTWVNPDQHQGDLLARMQVYLSLELVKVA